MRTRVTWGRGWIPALAVLALGVLLWPREVPDTGSARLSVTQGPVHVEPPGWRNRLVRRVPEHWRQRLGLWPPLEVQSTNPVLWIASGRPVADPGRGGLALTAVDSRGLENSVGMGVLGCAKRGKGWTTFAELKAFPRRAGRQRVHLRAIGGAGQLPGCEVQFPGVGAVALEPWAPVPFPASVVTEGTKATLESMAVRVEGEGPPRAYAVFTLPLTEDGAAAWRVENLRIADVTGNNVGAKGLVIESREGGRTEVSFDWPLWSDEPAWDARLELVPLGPEALQREEWAVVERLEAPASDAITEARRTLELRHGRVTVLGLVGEHATLPGREHDVQGLTTLELSYEPTIAGRTSTLALFQVQDEEGRAVEVERLGGLPLSWGMKVPPGTRSLSFVIAAYRPREAVFRVKPEFSAR